MSTKIAEATSKNDQELVNFLQDIIQVRNAYYLVQSGKAVTGGEAARNFFVTAQPTDSASVLLTKVERAKEEVKSDKAAMERAYKNLGKPATASQDKYIAGKIYTDKNGNRAKYIGNGEFEELGEGNE